MQLVHMRSFILGVMLSVSVAGSLVLAAQNEDVQKKWQAVWHGTEWIDDGVVIEAQKVAENFEYLYDQVGEVKNIYNILNTRAEIVAGCTYEYTEYLKIKAKCWGGASTYKKRGHLPSVLANAMRGYKTAKCPNDTIYITTGPPLYRCYSTDCSGVGDGAMCAPETFCTDIFVSAICVKYNGTDITEESITTPYYRY